MAKANRRRYSDWFTEEVWRTDNIFSLGRGLSALAFDGCPALTDRKALLCEVAYARRVMCLLPSGPCRAALELAEQAADAPGGPRSRGVLAAYSEIHTALDAYGPPPDFLPRPPLDRLTKTALELAATLCHPEDAAGRLRDIGAWPAQLTRAASGAAGAKQEERAQVSLLRDVFGHLFRQAALAPRRTPDVASLAQAAYEERILPSGELEPARLAVLADALEEAGCTNADILAHLRSPGPHVRGCWALDLVLGKE